jgi:hypothetical protein
MNKPISITQSDGTFKIKIGSRLHSVGERIEWGIGDFVYIGDSDDASAPNGALFNNSDDNCNLWYKDNDGVSAKLGGNSVDTSSSISNFSHTECTTEEVLVFQRGWSMPIHISSPGRVKAIRIMARIDSDGPFEIGITKTVFSATIGTIITNSITKFDNLSDYALGGSNYELPLDELIEIGEDGSSFYNIIFHVTNNDTVIYLYNKTIQGDVEVIDRCGSLLHIAAADIEAFFNLGTRAADFKREIAWVGLEMAGNAA